ncbi:MAG: hypothetical protein JKY99_04540 [Rhizobiales bacterium]|nr:hypothetical protein [Hyphomicrobiales bacterium]
MAEFELLPCGPLPNETGRKPVNPKRCRTAAKEDGWPTFPMIVDVGDVIELYAGFVRQGQGHDSQTVTVF